MAGNGKAAVRRLKERRDVEKALEQSSPGEGERGPRGGRGGRASGSRPGRHPSGRIIKFPNSKVLNTPVFNYSWPLFPYIWNEIKLQIAYQSDLEFVAKTMQEVAEEELGPKMLERVRVYRNLLAQTPVDRLTVQEKPVVIFRVSDSTWLEAILRYLVNPRRAGRVKTELLRKLLARLNRDPTRVMFPKADARYGRRCAIFLHGARPKESRTGRGRSGIPRALYLYPSSAQRFRSFGGSSGPGGTTLALCHRQEV